MSYTKQNDIAEITCDKCGKTDWAAGEDSGRELFNRGWTMNRDARKYTHLCFDCLPKRQKETVKWSIKRFG